MKKILGVSLVALMAVSTARADIASTAYVDAHDTATLTSAQGYTDTKIGNLGNDANSQPYADVAAAIAGAVAGGTANVLTSTNYATTLGSVYVPQTTTVNGEALSSNVTLDGADIALTGYTKGSDGSAVAAADTINAAIGKLENQIGAKADSADLSSYVPTTTTVNGEALSSNVTLDGADIALTGYTKGSDDSAVAAADTINAAISKLENQIDGKQGTIAAGTYVETAQGSGSANGILTTDASGNVEVSSSIANTMVTGLGDLATLSAVGSTEITDGSIANADIASDAAIAMTKIAMPTTTGSDGVYVLTGTINNGVITYKWESITRPAQQGGGD